MSSDTQTTTQPLISSVEIWIYDPESGRLICEGAWPKTSNQGQVSHSLDDASEIAAAAGERKFLPRWTAGGVLELYLPSVVDGNLEALTRIVWRLPAEAIFAYECWQRTERDELTIADSGYQGLETLARISSAIRFPRGSGLPGLAWGRRSPVVAGHLAENPNFMRTIGRDVQEPLSGIALPCFRGEYELENVVLLLSGDQFPMALGWETWVPESEAAAGLLRREAIYPGLASSEGLPDRLPLGGSTVSEAYLSRLPVLTTNLSDSQHQAELSSLGVSAYLALPVFNGERLVAVLGILV